jgi:hypothetical protein
MKAGQMDSWPGHQDNQSGDKIQRLKYDMGSAIAPRCFQLIADLALRVNDRRLVDTAGLVTSQKKAVNPNRINRFGMTGVSGFA